MGRSSASHSPARCERLEPLVRHALLVERLRHGVQPALHVDADAGDVVLVVLCRLELVVRPEPHRVAAGIVAVAVLGAVAAVLPPAADVALPPDVGVALDGAFVVVDPREVEVLAALVVRELPVRREVLPAERGLDGVERAVDDERGTAVLGPRRDDPTEVAVRRPDAVPECVADRGGVAHRGVVAPGGLGRWGENEMVDGELRQTRPRDAWAFAVKGRPGEAGPKTDGRTPQPYREHPGIGSLTPGDGIATGPRNADLSSDTTPFAIYVESPGVRRDSDKICMSARRGRRRKTLLSSEPERHVAAVPLEVRDGVLDARERYRAALSAVALDRRRGVGEHLVDRPLAGPLIVARQCHVDDGRDLAVLGADDTLAEHLLDEPVPDLLLRHGVIGYGAWSAATVTFCSTDTTTLSDRGYIQVAGRRIHP